ncbi:DNA topoisomerase I [Pirellula staleyi DSM 6068]|uniref:DNA topoisomerase 1 n=1 Tax=Pirellula staleyi (strain ATCC 27377 / DSM 6068 / ICPB 4128) TaxID=530564 RepID=D2QYN7_PIRSD|nr:type I DNA topoisomerase [Pirellula staleyi]ADB18196.1 DNA topoisomerase I [Pirellula staleyi DSM 6068]
MAKRASTGNKALVIVESPAKARTISKFLGPDYTVEASIGHIRDLPQGSKEIPKEYKGEKWAYLGVNVDDGFTPIYIVPPDKKQHVSKLKQLLKESDSLFLATDEDREGEAISWHLAEVLNPKVPVKRLVFHEITEEAIKGALANPRDIDDGLVRAQETRRILDRLYGYEVSQLLWRKVAPRLSAGRVQSVAVRMIVERERARMAFRSATYFDLLGRFASAEGKEFDAELVSVGGRRIPTGKDFDSTTGLLKDSKLLQMSEQEALALAERLKVAKFQVTGIEDRPYTRKPSDPFTTSTLQQEANRKLGFTARRTMDVAQSLYENGYITYMRTDSTNLAQVAIDAARDLVRTEYGDAFVPAQPRIYKSKVKNAQEAHEAIRPAGHPFKLPQNLRSELNPDQFRLFDMIWKRTIASQMADARGRNITITLEGDGAVFQVTGKTIEFAGFLRAYVEGSDDPDAELADQERILPSVDKGYPLNIKKLDAKSHTTQPPARFSEASLTAALEERGIGRPSTYASIIETILARQYVFKKGNALVPTWTAFSVSKLLEMHLPKLVDYQFTAQMEDLLDSISRKESEHGEYLRQFYFGDVKPQSDAGHSMAVGDEGLKKLLETKIQEIDARDMSRFSLGKPEEGGDEVFVRVGKFGPFIEQGERKASIQQETAPDEITLARALEMLNQASVAEEPLGLDPETQKPVYMKQGRFGPYVQLGTADDEEKPKNASLLKGMTPPDVTLEVALKLLSLPRNLGVHATLGEPIQAFNGKFGPYIKCGSETRSLPKEISPLEVTAEQAIELLAQPKTRGGGRGQAAAREPLRTLEPSPVTNEPIKLLAGRYGAYVTDGQTNASLPKDMQPETLTHEQAVQLLADRAAKAPAGGRGRRKAAPKKAAVKKAAPKKAAAKKGAKKAAPEKKKVVDVPFEVEE